MAAPVGLSIQNILAQVAPGSDHEVLRELAANGEAWSRVAGADQILTPDEAKRLSPELAAAYQAVFRQLHTSNKARAALEAALAPPKAQAVSVRRMEMDVPMLEKKWFVQKIETTPTGELYASITGWPKVMSLGFDRVHRAVPNRRGETWEKFTENGSEYELFVGAWQRVRDEHQRDLHEVTHFNMSRYQRPGAPKVLSTNHEGMWGFGRNEIFFDGKSIYAQGVPIGQVQSDAQGNYYFQQKNVSDDTIYKFTLDAKGNPTTPTVYFQQLHESRGSKDTKLTMEGFEIGADGSIYFLWAGDIYERKPGAQTPSIIQRPPGTSRADNSLSTTMYSGGSFIDLELDSHGNLFALTDRGQIYMNGELIRDGEGWWNQVGEGAEDLEVDDAGYVYLNKDGAVVRFKAR